MHLRFALGVPRRHKGTAGKGAAKVRASAPQDTGGVQLMDVVFPPTVSSLSATSTIAPASPSQVLPSQTQALAQAHSQLIEDTHKLYERERFERKRDQLERMERSMAAACLALERVSPVLFRAAMVRALDEKMPIERRVPLDTPPLGGWNHENRLRTDVRR